MREKIARWLRQYKLNEVEVDNPEVEDGIIKWDKASVFTKGYWLKDVNEILTLISEEIEKAENPYSERHTHTAQHSAYEEARQDFLSLLKE